jgi:anti-sigma factor RsiW
VDGQLSAARRDEIEHFLATHPEDRALIDDWLQQNTAMRDLLRPVLDEPVPGRLRPLRSASAWQWRGIAAGLAIAVLSAGAAWSLRGTMDAEAARVAFANVMNDKVPAATDSELSGFARRAAVAHAVYSPDARRPVEVEQEQALVTWLTKRMGTAVKAPSLGTLGYHLIGGRLLPGDKAPVAQFMYGSADGQKLTLYVTHEVAGQDTAFRFGTEGGVNVFYWVEDHFGYAISAGADRSVLAKVSEEVYRQLKPN